MTSRITYFIIISIVLLTQCESKENGSGNRLSKASSPYLKEHADNPVDWFEWGPEALTKAQKERKPLLISIGYASCHWCHVMEEESFMDTTVARFMNDHFVSIKIDREERPDIDQIYINAAQLISGNAGWPLNAFALPDGKPFFVATYYPKDQWLKVLQQIVDLYKNDFNKLSLQADAITNGIQKNELTIFTETNPTNFSKQNYADVLSSWQSDLDYLNGGLSGSPKFPLPSVWESLLQHHYLTADQKSLDAVTITLNKMANGGIYDQLAGGFSRYATDSAWNIPHFEKMLYDNGQLVSLYAHAYQATHNSSYAEIIQETLSFVKRELTSPEGGFYSSINADSEGEEGKFYAWTKPELEKLLDPKTANLFFDYYTITDKGNWEDEKNILYKNSTDEEFARKHSISVLELEEIIPTSKKIIFDARSKRVAPSRDEKILTAWNALMMMGYIDAYHAIADDDYLDIALNAAKFLEKNSVRNDGRLWRNFKDGKGSIDAFMDDYALLAKAYQQLYQATFDIHWLELSRKITDYAVLHFHDSKIGMFYYTSDQSEQLVARKMEINDNVIPSSNSVMTEVLFTLGEYYDQEDYRTLCKSMINQITKAETTLSPFHANWARVLGVITYQPFEVAIMGNDAVQKSKEIHTHYLPTSLFMGGTKETLPLLENKLVSGKTMIYVCQNKVCKLPVQEVDKAIKQLQKDHN